MYNKILVTLDGSELAEKILPHAQELAKMSGGEVTFIRVVHAEVLAGPLSSGNDIRLALMEEATRAEAYLETTAQKFAEQGIKTDTIVVQGDAASRIIEFAQENNFDIICMTTHGRSGVGRLMMGSVAEKITRETLKPVLLIRALKSAPEAKHINEQEVFVAK